jgi:hypothetical protein
VVEQGVHTQLLASQGLYAHLYAQQNGHMQTSTTARTNRDTPIAASTLPTVAHKNGPQPMLELNFAYG